MNDKNPPANEKEQNYRLVPGVDLDGNETVFKLILSEKKDGDKDHGESAS